MGVHVPLDLDLDTVYVVEVLLLHTSLPGEMPIPHSNNCLLNFCRKAYESKSPRSKLSATAQNRHLTNKKNSFNQHYGH